MNADTLKMAIMIGTIIFSAGGVYYAFKQSRRDLNGLGRKVRDNEQKTDERYLVTVVAALVICKPEDRKFLAEKFLEAGRGQK